MVNDDTSAIPRIRAQVSYLRRILAGVLLVVVLLALALPMAAAAQDEECHYEGVCLYSGFWPYIEGSEVYFEFYFHSGTSRWLETYGVVYDLASHASPDGYPGEYVNTSPPESQYSQYESYWHNGNERDMACEVTVNFVGVPPGSTVYWRPWVNLAESPGAYVYGEERSFVFPCEQCHYDYAGVCVSGSAEIDGDAVKFYGLYGSSPYSYPVASYGIVADFESHPNPDGFPGEYVDTPPSESGYTEWSIVEVEGESLSELEFEVDGSAWWHELPGQTLYWRPFVDLMPIGDYVYGPEYELVPPGGCAVLDQFTSGTIGLPAAVETLLMEALDYDEQMTINAVELLLYRQGEVHEMTLMWYLGDPFTREPTGDPLVTVVQDVSGITTNTTGEWVRFTFDDLVLAADTDYCLVVTADVVNGFDPEGPAVMWLAGDTGPREALAGFYTIVPEMGWQWVGYDGTYRLIYCEAVDESEEGLSGMYQIWGHKPSTFPLWYQAWPSFLKLAYIGIVLVTAVLVYRREDKPRYPELNDDQGP